MEADSVVGSFEVGVAIIATDDGATGSESRSGQGGAALPGYDEAAGLKLPGRHSPDRPPALVVKGGEAVRIATDAIARPIGLAAQRIAAAIEAQAVALPEPGKLGLESVDVSFGITLSAGVQALFTAQAESSVQVNISLVRRPDAGG